MGIGEIDKDDVKFCLRHRTIIMSSKHSALYDYVRTVLDLISAGF